MSMQSGTTAAFDAMLAPPPDHPDGWVLGRNPSVRKIALHAQRAAEVQCTVLVSGETGTGKEVWARLLHKLGPRRDRVFRSSQLCGVNSHTGREPAVRS